MTPLRALLPRVRRRVVTYGKREDSDLHLSGSKIKLVAGVVTNCFALEYKKESLGEFELNVPGDHNVLNATAAVAVGLGLEIPVAKIREGLAQFGGVDRRFQLRGAYGGVRVIDDYGHHPTEIKATLAAARQYAPDAKIHVIFQPHRYTRTYLLMDEFANAFTDADDLYVLDIYAASEQPIAGVTGLSLAQRIRATGFEAAEFAASTDAAMDAAVAAAKPGDIIVTLGAGSVSQLGPQILQRLGLKK
jgi:UDP-N-acetylmuramate--alanine ligase